MSAPGPSWTAFVLEALPPEQRTRVAAEWNVARGFLDTISPPQVGSVQREILTMLVWLVMREAAR